MGSLFLNVMWIQCAHLEEVVRRSNACHGGGGSRGSPCRRVRPHCTTPNIYFDSKSFFFSASNSALVMIPFFWRSSNFMSSA